MAEFDLSQAQPLEPLEYDISQAQLIGIPQPRGALRGAADLALEVGSGAIKGVKFISDAAGASNPVSDVLADADAYVKGLQSAQAKGEDQRMAAIMAEAQDAGVWEQVKSAFSAAGEAPVRSALGALGTSAPVIAASLLPGVREATWGTRIAALGGMSGVQGAGIVKGSIYDAVERRMLEANATPEEAAAEASRQQAYGGPNSPNIMLAGGLGVAAGITGVQPAIVRALGGGAGRKTAQELVRSLLTGLVKEVPLEATQGGQEQFAQNIAEQNAGFDTPTWRGVAGNWALEGLLAAPGGLAGGALDATGRPRPSASPPIAGREGMSTHRATYSCCRPAALRGSMQSSWGYTAWERGSGYPCGGATCFRQARRRCAEERWDAVSWRAASRQRACRGRAAAL
jgi:hypothetical protein